VEDVARLPVLGQIVRQRWRLLIVLGSLGAIVGFGLSLLFSPGYEAGSKVLLYGALAKEELASEAEIAMSGSVLDRTAAELRWGVSSAVLRDSVHAAVSDGNVIEITGTARSRDRAMQLTERATQEYVAVSSKLKNDAVEASAVSLRDQLDAARKRKDEATTQLAEVQASPVLNEPTPEGAQAKAEVQRLQNVLVTEQAEIDQITKRTQDLSGGATDARSRMAVIEPVAVRGAATPTLLHFVLGGIVLFVLIGAFGLLVAARTDRRLRDSAAIAAALGAPVLATVDVSVDGRAVSADVPKVVTGRGAWLRGLLLGESGRPTSVASERERLDEELRFRRVLARLRRAAAANLRLLVVIAGDDLPARHAVVHLAASATADRTPVTVVTDDLVLSELVEQVAEGAKEAEGMAGGDALPITVRSSTELAPVAGRTVLRVVDVLPARPTVPDCGQVAGTLVVVAAGTRTGWELVGIGEACLDAGHPVLGAIVVSGVHLAAPAETTAATESGSEPVRAGTSGEKGP